MKALVFGLSRNPLLVIFFVFHCPLGSEPCLLGGKFRLRGGAIVGGTLTRKGEISERELKELKDDLKAEMPDAVRQKLERDKPEAGAGNKQDSPASTIPVNMDALMRQTGLGSNTPAL